MMTIVCYAVVGGDEDICQKILWRKEFWDAKAPLPLPAIGANYLTSDEPNHTYTVRGHYWRHDPPSNRMQVVVAMTEDE
jgi:hypothetical protein